MENQTISITKQVTHATPDMMREAADTVGDVIG